jgi:DNA mismatch repair protein MutL
MEALLTRPIRLLPPETASRIAAGEVIERPLSALKEILENALDANARNVEIRVGASLDRHFAVSDDGSGIAAGELELALERHATSKLSSLEDLDRLVTLGFRGEALPSIAAVSRLRLTSRTREAENATTLVVEGGQLIERGSAGRAPGTTVEVADLFYNTPARRKFLGSPAGELRAALRMLEAYALATPEVGFRLVVDDRERLHWPAVDGARARASQLWGARLASQWLEARGERDGLQAFALLALPEQARATREGQIVIINRRWVTNPMLAQAVRQAYGNLLPAGRFPAFVLWLTIPPDRLDVNVHPTKREVRFATEDPVFTLVAGTCAKPLALVSPPFRVVPGGGSERPWATGSSERAEPPSLGLAFDAPREAGYTAPPAADAGSPAAGAAESAAAPEASAAIEPELWQLHRTYILAPVRGGLVIVDQHAAHERILYEEARARLEGQRGASQQLLFPALVDLSRDQYELLLELGPWLQLLGWDVAPLGPPTAVVQGVPSELRHEQPARFLQDLLDGIGDHTGRSAEEDISEQLARTYACHAATRAGDPLTQAEMRTLVDRLFATSRPHGDPHGRPTFVRLDLEELHRRFGRS